MLEVFKQMLHSKKAVTTIISVVTYVVGSLFNPELANAVSEVLYVIGTYLVGQGLADFGKEKK